MRSRIITLLLCIVALFVGPSLSALAQQPATRSHVERFSTPAARAERSEAEATTKLTADANDTEALNARALARMRLGRYSEALDDLRRAAALKPGNADYQSNLGYVLWKLGRVEDAINAERAALKFDEKNFTAHFQLGRFLVRSGDPKLFGEAATHLKRALELDPRQYDVRLELIALYRLQGDTVAAMAQLDVLEDARPSDPRVIYVRALLATDRNDMNAAISGFREALRLDPSLYGAWQDLGLALIKLQRWPEAVETFADMSRRQPDSVDAAYLHALALFNAGRKDEAEREARRTLRIDAGASAAHTLLGIILATRGDNTEANDALSQAVALDPKSFDAQFYLGRVQYGLKDYTGAIKSLRAAVALDPRHQEARFFLGTALEVAGDSAAALAEYQELIKLDPQSVFGLVGLGALLAKQGKSDEAIAALKRAIALDPARFESHWALGRALMQTEQFNDAVEALKRAVQLAPDRADAHYQLGLALRRLGRNAEAAREFALVEKLNKEFRTGTKQ
ncbi:MAG TPA: tetratricopeptide repeat protein [Blastocatellia bacterium]|nr:tetratricopeptide repeat protein [Blastocatellia bacterium]